MIKNSSASFIVIPVHLLVFGYTKFHKHNEYCTPSTKNYLQHCIFHSTNPITLVLRSLVSEFFFFCFLGGGGRFRPEKIDICLFF